MSRAVLLSVASVALLVIPEIHSVYVYVVPSNKRNGVSKVDSGLPGKENSNSHGARPVNQIISTIQLIPTSNWSIKNLSVVPRSEVPILPSQPHHPPPCG